MRRWNVLLPTVLICLCCATALTQEHNLRFSATLPRVTFTRGDTIEVVTTLWNLAGEPQRVTFPTSRAPHLIVVTFDLSHVQPQGSLVLEPKPGFDRALRGMGHRTILAPGNSVATTHDLSSKYEKDACLFAGLYEVVAIYHLADRPGRPEAVFTPIRSPSVSFEIVDPPEEEERLALDLLDRGLREANRSHGQSAEGRVALTDLLRRYPQSRYTGRARMILTYALSQVAVRSGEARDWDSYMRECEALLEDPRATDYQRQLTIYYMAQHTHSRGDHARAIEIMSRCTLLGAEGWVAYWRRRHPQ